MPQKMLIEFSEGKKLYFGGGGPKAGHSDVAFGETAMQASSKAFKSALGTLGDLVNFLEDSVGKLPNRPDKVELEFGATLTADCDLWIVSGEGEAEFKVKLAWDKKES